MKNKYIIQDECAYIYLKNIQKYATIDKTDLSKANEFKGTWIGWLNKHTQTYYITGSYKKEDGKRGILWLHRWILDIDDPKILIDHKDNDSLNTRKNNLETVDNKKNHQNMKKQKNLNDFTGTTWNKKLQKWQAQIMNEGKHISLGLYNDRAIAAEAYQSARVIYHPYGSSCAEVL